MKTSPRAIWKADGTMGSGERGNKRVLSGRDPVPGVLSPNLQYAFKCSSDAGRVPAATFEETKAGAEVHVGVFMM